MTLRERDAWIALVNATIRRANAECEHDPLAALEESIAAKDKAIETLRRYVYNVDAVIVDKHGLWPKEEP